MWKKDAALYEQAGSFRRVMDIDAHQEEKIQGLFYREDEKPYIKLCLNSEMDVQLVVDKSQFFFKETEPGIYEADLPLKPGFYVVKLLINGIEALSPYLNLTFEKNRPVNYLDIGPLPRCFQCRKIPHGTIHYERYWSNVLKRTETCFVYTPPGYEEGERFYPVLYLQHGNGENERAWIDNGKIHFLMDNLLAEEKAVPMIIVMANGMPIFEKEDGHYLLQKASFTQQLLTDIIPFTEEKYRIKRHRLYRAMAGLSMGSKQTSITVMTHLSMFAWAGLFSGFMDDFLDDYHNTHLEQLLREKDVFNKEMKLFFRSIGTEDEGFCYFLENDRFCEQYGIQTIRKLYSGGHDWNVWRKAEVDFLQMLFRE